MKRTINNILSVLVITGLSFGFGLLCGVGKPLLPNQNPTTSAPSILWRVTAFCPCGKCCGKWSDGITASGHPAVGEFVAAPPEIPFGTRLAIDGYAGGLPVPVLDRGGAIKGKRLDVYFDTHQEALDWGVKYLSVKIFRRDN
ncbi:hypothetical protein LCGC14_0400620 [marine sediment metagenome]|uniref:3D domain-containing protein n=1 Tax=marine sediment metagenome TaxID=412755 RepID=A0A0F9TF61_9ZZZZ